MQSYEQKRDFKQVLLAHPQLEQVSEAQLVGWLDPVNYLGSAPEKVDEVIRAANASGLLPAEQDQ